jgi:putative colanic acid biosynthesis UDP-glucose lipid carrier transferase
VICGLLLPVDLATLGLAAALAHAIRFHGPLADFGTSVASPAGYATLAAFGCLLAVNVFQVAGLYATDVLKNPGPSTRRLVMCWIGVAAMLATAGFLTKSSEDYSRLWSLLWFGFGLAALLAVRWAFFSRVARWVADGRLDQKLAIIGTGALAEAVAAHFLTRPESGIRIVGLFADDVDMRASSDPARLRADSLDQLVARIRSQQIDTVLVAMADADHQRMSRIFDRLSEAPVDVRLCPGAETLHLLGRDVSHYAGVPAIDVMDRPFSDWR